MSTTYDRDRDGKAQAETRLPFGTGKQQLRISTRKSYYSGLETRAHVVEVDGSFIRHAIGLGRNGLGDYSNLVSSSNARCTEAAVKRQHEAALTVVDEIVAQANAHYAARDERLAKERAEAESRKNQQGA